MRERPATLLRPFAGFLLALAMFVPTPQSAEAGVSLGHTYRDRRHKFSLKLLKGFEQVPLKVDEENVVAKFRDPKAKGNIRGTFNAEITVVRIKKGKNKGPVVTGEKKGPINPFKKEYKDAWDATIENLAIMGAGGKKIELDRDDYDKIKSKDKPKIPGKLYKFEAPIWGMMGRDNLLFIMLAVFEKDDVEYGVACYCGAPLRKSHERVFKSVCKSFKWFDKRSKDVESRSELDGVNITARKRAQIERSIVKGWDLIVSKKKNYIVLYNTANNRNHMLARIIADRIEKIREQIYEKQFPPAEPIETVCIARVCKDRREYTAYGGPGGSAGYWSSRDEELVFYDASPSKKPDDDTLAVLYHEAFHQYIYYSVGNVAPHSWFNEGHGDYYAGAKYKGGKFKIGPFNWRVGIIKGAIVKGPRGFSEPDDVEEEEEEDEETEDDNPEDEGGPPKERPRPQRPRMMFQNDGGYTPLKYLVRFSQPEYYSYARVCYAQGWSLIYFLREIVPKNKKYNEKWGHILDTYFDVLKAEVNKTDKLVPKGRFAEEEDEPGDKKDGDEEDKKDEEEKKGDDKKDGEDKPDGKGEDDEDGEGDKDGDGEGEGDEGEGGEEELGIPMPGPTGFGSAAALNKAVDEAFKGIDWEEFEKAWAKHTKRGK